jgi:hypothetical protein
MEVKITTARSELDPATPVNDQGRRRSRLNHCVAQVTEFDKAFCHVFLLSLG